MWGFWDPSDETMRSSRLQTAMVPCKPVIAAVLAKGSLHKETIYWTASALASSPSLRKQEEHCLVAGWLLTGSLEGPFGKSCLSALPVGTTSPLRGSGLQKPWVLSGLPSQDAQFNAERQRTAEYVPLRRQGGLRQACSQCWEGGPPWASPLNQARRLPGQPHKPHTGNTNHKGPPAWRPPLISKMLQVRI